MRFLTPDEIEALLLSLKIASVAVAVALPFAVATALILARSFRGKALLDGIVQLPLVLPPVAPLPAAGRAGEHTEHLEPLLAEFQSVARAHPGATW